MIINTGDDIELYGLHISPDIDIVMYTLAGIVDEEKGWGIRGDTFHFEVVAGESARGLMDVALEFGIPIGNGILTTEDEAQARSRLDKGAEAVRAAVEMTRLKLRPRDA